MLFYIKCCDASFPECQLCPCYVIVWVRLLNCSAADFVGTTACVRREILLEHCNKNVSVDRSGHLVPLTKITEVSGKLTGQIVIFYTVLDIRTETFEVLTLLVCIAHF